MSDDHVRLISRSVMLLAFSIVAATCTGCMLGSVMLMRLDVPTHELKADVSELRAIVDHVHEKAESNWSEASHTKYAAGIDRRLAHIESLLEKKPLP